MESNETISINARRQKCELELSNAYLGYFMLRLIANG